MPKERARLAFTNYCDRTEDSESIASVKNRKEYEQLLQGDEITKTRTIEKQLVSAANAEAFTVDGFCVPCDRKVSFLVELSLSNHMCCFNACNRCLSGVKRFKSHHWFGYFLDNEFGRDIHA
jgi:hypothetical protein